MTEYLTTACFTRTYFPAGRISQDHMELEHNRIEAQQISLSLRSAWNAMATTCIWRKYRSNQRILYIYVVRYRAA